MTYVFNVDYNPPTTSDLIYQFIKDNPRCSRVEISAYIGLATKTVNSYLSNLRFAGKIRRHRFEGARKNGVLWEVGREEGLCTIDIAGADGRPRQQTVKEWEPCKLRDPMIDLLFGRVA